MLKTRTKVIVKRLYKIGSFCVVNVVHWGLDCRVAVPAPRKDVL